MTSRRSAESGRRQEARRRQNRRRGADVGEVADASFLSEIFMNALMMNQQWRRKQMAFILNTSLIGHKCWMIY